MRTNQSPAQSDFQKRLKRAEGHLQAVQRMVAEKRPDARVARQLAALEGSIGAAKRDFIHTRIEHRLSNSEASERVTRELKQIAGFL